MFETEAKDMMGLILPLLLLLGLFIILLDPMRANLAVKKGGCSPVLVSDNKPLEEFMQDLKTGSESRKKLEQWNAGSFQMRNGSVG